MLCFVLTHSYCIPHVLIHALQASGIKATVGDGSRGVLRGNQLNQNYFQSFGGSTNDLVRTTNVNDVVDVA